MSESVYNGPRRGACLPPESRRKLSTIPCCSSSCSIVGMLRYTLMRMRADQKPSSIRTARMGTVWSLTWGERPTSITPADRQASPADCPSALATARLIERNRRIRSNPAGSFTVVLNIYPLLLPTRAWFASKICRRLELTPRSARPQIHHGYPASSETGGGFDGNCFTHHQQPVRQARH